MIRSYNREGQALTPIAMEIRNCLGSINPNWPTTSLDSLERGTASGEPISCTKKARWLPSYITACAASRVFWCVSSSIRRCCVCSLLTHRYNRDSQSANSKDKSGSNQGTLYTETRTVRSQVTSSTHLYYCYRSWSIDLQSIRMVWLDPVLDWLRNLPSKGSVFVLNRASATIDLLPAIDWRYVATDCNPADLASRGVFPQELHHIHHHASARVLMALTAEEYYISGLRSLARKTVHHCVPCRRTSATPCVQLMGQLPTVRVVLPPHFRTWDLTTLIHWHWREEIQESQLTAKLM